MNFQVQRLKVVSLDRDYFEVSWQLDGPGDPLDYEFSVQRSESPMGPWDDISPAFRDRYLFLDMDVPQANRWRILYYRIKVTYLPTQDVRYSEPGDPGAEPDLIAMEIRKHMQLLFREYNGHRSWVLPVRTFGPRCKCWDKTLKKKTTSRCITCYDTGFLHGYHHPIESWIQYDPTANNNQQTNLGQIQQNNTTARMGYFPALKPNDLIIEPENRRWRVVTVSATEHGRTALLQELQLHEIPMTDIEFEIKLDIGSALRDMYINPEANYANPHNLEAAVPYKT